MRALVAAAVLLGLAVGAAAEDDQARAQAEEPESLRVRGRLAEELAYRLHDPGDVSKLRTTGWLEGKFTFSEAVSLRAAVRTWYDAVFDVTNRYPSNVERDQKTEFELREALLAVSARDLDVRLGRQQIVWGEAISTFVTDVVNPKDFREFILPDFAEIRIPIWALNFTYRLRPHLNFEGVWTPDTLHNKLPKAGAEFQFAPPDYRFTQRVVGPLPDNPDQFSLTRSEGGFRLSYLVEGWDMSFLYYDLADKTRVLFQRREPQPSGPDVIFLVPEHPRLHIVGGTLTKSVKAVVLRSEAALTINKHYETTDPLDADGVERRDTLDYLIGVSYSLFSRIDTDLQLSQKVLMGSATNLTRGAVEDEVTTTAALRLATGFFDNTVNPSVLFVVNANRADYRLSARVDYFLTGAVTVSAGVDLFSGPPQTLYGQFDDNDRAWVTTSWRF